MQNCGLLLIVLTLQTACKKETALEPRSGVGSNDSTFQAELDRVREGPEPNPTKRPLVLSRPATNRRDWTLQALQDGYRATGRTNALWDSKVQAVFGEYADYRLTMTNWSALQAALAAVDTDCNDPMVQYIRARYREKVSPQEKVALEFLRVDEAMIRSKYHPFFKFYAGLRAVEAADIRDHSRIVWTSVNLEDLARDTNAPVDDVIGAATLWLEQSYSKDWTAHVTSDLDGILERNWGQTEQWFRFRGFTEVRRAWGERGTGFAGKVTDKGWQGFREHLDEAEKYLMKAWQMNSNKAETAYLMMKVELGQGQGRARMETWFNHAMALAPAYYGAAELMSFYLEPRWYGSEAKSLTFARSCVASDKWSGNVPLVLANLHHSLAGYYRMSNSPAYWQQPHVWKDVKSSYEKFFTLNPEAAGWRHDYAMDAYNCGQYSTFLTQTKLFTLGTNYDFFGGKARFEDMLKTAGSARGQSP